MYDETGEYDLLGELDGEHDLLNGEDLPDNGEVNGGEGGDAGDSDREDGEGEGVDDVTFCGDGAGSCRGTIGKKKDRVGVTLRLGTDTDMGGGGADSSGKGSW